MKTDFAMTRLPQKELEELVEDFADCVRCGAAPEHLAEATMLLLRACGPQATARRKHARADVLGVVANAALRCRGEEAVWGRLLSTLTLLARDDDPAPLPSTRESLARASAEDLRRPGALAWEVDVGGLTGEDCARVEVLFARDAGHARRRIADTYGVPPSSTTSVVPEPRRLPEWDAYAPGPVPAQAYLARGYALECRYCGHGVSKDGCELCPPEPGAEPPSDGASVWCGAACRDAERAREEANRAAIVDAQARVLEDLAGRWPGSMPVRASAILGDFAGHAYRGQVDFTFPGATTTASYAEGSELFVSPQDAEAWRSFAAGQARAKCLRVSVAPPPAWDEEPAAHLLRRVLLPEAAYEVELRTRFGAGGPVRHGGDAFPVPAGRMLVVARVAGGVPVRPDLEGGERIHEMVFDSRSAADAVARFVDEVVQRREAVDEQR